MNQVWDRTSYSYISSIREKRFCSDIMPCDFSLSLAETYLKVMALGRTPHRLDPKRLSLGCHHWCDYKRSPNCRVQWGGLNVYQPSCIWFFLPVLFNYGKILTLWLRLFWEPRTSSAKDQEWYVPLGSNSWVQLFSETMLPTRRKSRLLLSELLMQRGQKGNAQLRQQAETGISGPLKIFQTFSEPEGPWKHCL